MAIILAAVVDIMVDLQTSTTEWWKYQWC